MSRSTREVWSRSLSHLDEEYFFSPEIFFLFSIADPYYYFSNLSIDYSIKANLQKFDFYSLNSYKSGDTRVRNAFSLNQTLQKAVLKYNFPVTYHCLQIAIVYSFNLPVPD